MKTEDKPEKIMAMMMRFRWSGGKLISMLVEDQSSRKSDATTRIGMDRTLL